MSDCVVSRAETANDRKLRTEFQRDKNILKAHTSHIHTQTRCVSVHECARLSGDACVAFLIRILLSSVQT